MAQKRMLNKGISVSEQVADLSKDAQLFYSWSIAHGDDFGLLPFSSRKLKGLVVPFWDMSLRDVENMIQEIINAKLWTKVEIFGQEWYCFPKWFDHQELRRDINPKVYANLKVKWDDYELIKKLICNETEQSVTSPSESVEEVSIREDRLREEKLREVNPGATKVAEKDIVAVIKLFETVNPSIDNLYKNTTQRKACERLLKKWTIEQIKVVVDILPELNADKYARGKSITPHQMEENLGYIKAWIDGKKNNSNKVVKIL